MKEKMKKYAKERGRNLNSRHENAKVRVREQDQLEKKFVFYEKDEKSEDFLIDELNEFRESESVFLFCGKI